MGIDRNPAVNRLIPSEALLLVIDVQERLFPAMYDELGTRLARNLERWGGAAPALGLPVMLTEQYPKGLGPTLPKIVGAFPEAPRFEKVCFGASDSEEVDKAIADSGAKTILVAGMETHICVFQSVRALVDAGYRVQVLEDAVASRTRDNFEVGLELIRATGAIVTSTEAALFDLLGRAGTDAFKVVSKLVR